MKLSRSGWTRDRQFAHRDSGTNNNAVDRETGHIDYGSLRSNSQFLLTNGASGVLAAGSTGEAPLLADAEVASLVRELRSIVPADKWLIVGESTSATRAACRSASETGADIVLVRAPSYFSSAISEQSLIEHFSRVADHSPVPVMLYNMPKYTHVNFAPSLIAAMASHENVIGIKDSSGDIDNLRTYREAAPNWCILVGSGAALLDGLAAGAAGGIVAVGNFALGLAVQVFDLHATNEIVEASDSQKQLGTLHRQIVAPFGPAGVKKAMDLVNLRGGPVRPPLSELTDAETEQTRNLLAKLLPS